MLHEALTGAIEAKSALEERAAEVLARLGAERLIVSDLQARVANGERDLQESEAMLNASRMAECELRRELVESRIVMQAGLGRVPRHATPFDTLDLTFLDA